MRECDIIGRAGDDIGVCIDQALGRRGDLRQLEHIAQLLCWLVGPLFSLLVQAFAHSPAGGSIGVITILVVTALLRHRTRPWYPCAKCAGRTLPVITPPGRGFSSPSC